MKIHSKCYVDLSEEVKFVGLEDFRSKTGRGHILPSKAADELYKKTALESKFPISFIVKKFLCRHDMQHIYTSNGINNAKGRFFNFYYCYKCSYYQCHLEDSKANK